MDEPYRGLPAFERGLELLGFDPFERLDEGTRFQQPAIFLCSVTAWDLWREESPDDFAQVRAAAAAAAMADAGDVTPGSMVAILGGDDHAVRALAGRLGLTIANDNAPGQLVLSGATDAVAPAEELA